MYLHSNSGVMKKHTREQIADWIKENQLHTRQKAYEAKDLENLKIFKEQVRKAVARDRLEFKLQNFEEELWFDIKQA